MGSVIYTRCFRQPAQWPLAYIWRSTDRSRVCLDNPRFTDDVDYVLFRCLITCEGPITDRMLITDLDVVSRIFQATIGVTSTCEEHSRRVVCDLLGQVSQQS
jgi:hypothetical protein